MLKIKQLSLKNFMSVGNITQTLIFDESELFLVIGENIDAGGNDNKNGVGKSNIINALSYVLFGKTTNSIKLDNLINRFNEKEMLVTVIFEKNGVVYEIQRGRKPNILLLYRNGEETIDETRGENSQTQQNIDAILGFNHTIFNNIIVLTTMTEEFLAMKANDQREMIELLLGVTLLTDKANSLKEIIKETKALVRDEEVYIKALNESNEKIQQNINLFQIKEKEWENNFNKKTQEYKDAISLFEQLNIEDEIASHNFNLSLKEKQSKKDFLIKAKKTKEIEIKEKQKSLNAIFSKIKSFKENTCPTCNQSINEKLNNELKNNLEVELSKLQDSLSSLQKESEKINKELDKFDDIIYKSTFYDDIQSAFNHRASILAVTDALNSHLLETNPHTDNITSLKESGIQKINYSKLEEYQELLAHQEFLLKLLINKDSFIRKKIINQNLPYLNSRLRWYLDKFNYPFDVTFLSDLTVEIVDKGKSSDFHNLSRGEKTRVSFSLSLAFRELFENMNFPINILIVDELIDNGIDSNGVEISLQILKKLKRDYNKSVFLITHKEELLGRVDNILKVTKQDGFTNFAFSTQIQN